MRGFLIGLMLRRSRDPEHACAPIASPPPTGTIATRAPRRRVPRRPRDRRDEPPGPRRRPARRRRVHEPGRLPALAKRGTRLAAGRGMGDLVRAAGGEAVELDWGESVEMGAVRVHCVPAQHFSGRSIAGNGRRLWAGWVIEGPPRRFYHAGDTGYFDGFRALRERFGRIDVAALPIGAYEPAAIMRFVHLDPEQAVRAAVELEAGRVGATRRGGLGPTGEPPHEPPPPLRAPAA